WVGSSSTLKGLQATRPLLEHLGRRIPGIQLKLVCDRFLELRDMPVVPCPWKEATEAAEIAAADIGISWLPDDLWSRGKCGLKVLQYHAAGLPVVANPIGSHREMIRDGETGFLASTPEEWVQAVTRLAGDARLRQRMGFLGREQVEADYSVSAWSETFVSSMTGPAFSQARSSWKVDRSGPSHRNAGFGPHAAQVRPTRALNQIGDR